MKKMNIYIGETGSGKTSKAKSLYQEIAKSKKYGTDKILVFVNTRNEKSNWKKEIKLKKRNSMNIYSYIGFIQEELEKYWPLVIEKEKRIKNKRLNPIFITFEAAQCLMNKTVEYYRKNNKLKEIIATDLKLSMGILSNIFNASLSELEYEKIGEKIYYSIEENREKSLTLLKDIDLIINRYNKRLIEEGVLDYSLSIYMYNKYLIKNKEYNEKLNIRFDKIIVDDFELQAPVIVSLLEEFQKKDKKIHCFYNSDKAYGIYRYNSNYIEKIIKNNNSIVKEIGKNKFIKKEISDFFYKINKIILNNIVEKDEIINNKRVIFNDNFKYRIEMINDITNKIKEELSNGIEYKEIAVITPFYDPLIEFFLENYFKEKNIKNLNTREKTFDEKYIFCMIVLICLIYNFEKIIINFDELNMFLSTILNIDKIRSNLLAREIFYKNNIKEELPIIKLKNNSRILEVNIEKYNKIAKWVNIKRKENKKDINSILEEIYNNFIIKEKINKQEINSIAKLQDLAKSFIETLKRFETIKYPEYEFVKFMREGTKSSETISDIELKNDNNGIILSTPSSFLNYSKNYKVIFLTDLGSSFWSPKETNNIQNPWVLSKDWGEERTFDFEFGIVKRREGIVQILKRVHKKCSEKIYLYNSDFSGKGQEQKNEIILALKKMFSF